MYFDGGSSIGDHLTPDGETSGHPDTQTVSYAEVSYVIVRACVICHGTRTVDEPCATCGNEDPPLVDDLGVVSATYKSRTKWLMRHIIGEPLARRRIKRANQRSYTLRETEEGQ